MWNEEEEKKQDKMVARRSKYLYFEPAIDTMS
jgi:hypothetical protein